MKKISFLFLLFIGSFAYSQIPEMRYAEMLWDSELYPAALDYYVKIAKHRPDDAVVNYRTAYCYNYVSEGHKALPYIKKSLRQVREPDPKQLNVMARAYQLTHQFDEAIKYYNLSDKKKKNSLGQQARLVECSLGKKLFENAVDVEVKNMGSNINGKAHDILPRITADYRILYFTSHRYNPLNKSQSPEDVYRSDYIDSSWTKAEWVKAPISTKINDACIGISADGQTMFLFKSSNNGDIFISHLDGLKWTKPEALPTNSPQRETSACISPDGNTIYFIRKNLVNSDIYFVQKMPSGNWTTAKRLPATVNSTLDEESPYMHPDGKTLYFSSKGHGTMGGYDVFKTIKTDTGWTKPVNLGYPINTAGDDWSFVLSADGYKGFYASVKKDGYGKQDLYSLDFKKPEATNLTLVKGTIRNEKGKLLKAEITITSLSDNKVINKTYSNKVTGQYLVSLPKGQDYGIQVIEDSSLIFSKNFSLENVEGYNEEIIDVELKSLKKGATFILENILFETAKSELKSESSLELDQLVLVLEKNKGLKIEIAGHTDNVGSVDSNQKLSEDRAKAVLDYLVSNGILISRLTSKGYGSSVAIADNTTEEGRRVNRRVEVVVK